MSDKKALQNIYDKATLKKRFEEQGQDYRTISFYRYVSIADPDALKNLLYEEWFSLGVLGRIYLAKEGVNAQISYPVDYEDKFKASLFGHFPDIPLKVAREETTISFYKLIIKVKPKIVADGLDDESFNPANTGTHLSAREFNDAMKDDSAVVVDMRNQYESEVGHFEGAICPDVDTFREELPYVRDLLQDDKDKKILLYCTGGIRCEKASAWLKHEGFKDVNQLRGGIIDYARQVEEEKLESMYKGKNFVFDGRLGERITEDVISNCHQCDNSCDDHTNCANDACHLLFIQCKPCSNQYRGCCSEKCQAILALSDDEQRLYRKSQPSTTHFRSRLRPLSMKSLTEA